MRTALCVVALVVSACNPFTVTEEVDQLEVAMKDAKPGKAAPVKPDAGATKAKVVAKTEVKR